MHRGAKSDQHMHHTSISQIYPRRNKPFILLHRRKRKNSKWVAWSRIDASHAPWGKFQEFRGLFDSYLKKKHDRLVLHVVAAIHGLNPQELAEKVYENTCRVFFPKESVDGTTTISQ